MALSKTINTRYNVPATYWKIVAFDVDWLTSRANVMLAGFTDQASREAGAEPIDVRGFRFDGPGFTGFSHTANNTELAYEKIKTSPEFADAIDVFEPGQTV